MPDFDVLGGGNNVGENRIRSVNFCLPTEAASKSTLLILCVCIVLWGQYSSS